jgi:hypothetical protein
VLLKEMRWEHGHVVVLGYDINITWLMGDSVFSREYSSYHVMNNDIERRSIFFIYLL